MSIARQVRRQELKKYIKAAKLSKFLGYVNKEIITMICKLENNAEDVDKIYKEIITKTGWSVEVLEAFRKKYKKVETEFRLFTI